MQKGPTPNIQSIWILEGSLEKNGAKQRFNLARLPAIVGRDINADHRLPFKSVSRQHARFLSIGNELVIEDLNSSNGTYVNHTRIDSAKPVKHGDILHFGPVELRVIDAQTMAQAHNDEDIGTKTIVASQLPDDDNWVNDVQELDALMNNRQITPLFQPIVDEQRRLFAYELLGRGARTALSTSPGALFGIAESMGAAERLSQLMREVGAEQACRMKLRKPVFLNTHPKELENPDRLVGSMRELHKRHTNLKMVLEIHELSLTDTDLVKFFKTELGELEIQLAFDDFGVGQSRLMEMVEAKPHLIKFDLAMIKDIDKGDLDRINLLKGLKIIADNLNITSLAECVSREGEFQVCRKMGFDLYQGYLFGRPEPLPELAVS